MCGLNMHTQTRVYFQLATAVRVTLVMSHANDFTGNGFRAAFYFSRHGYIQHLVIPKEHAVSHICYFECLNCLISPQKLSTNTSLQGPYVYYTYTCVHRIYTVQWIFDYLNPQLSKLLNM